MRRNGWILAVGFLVLAGASLAFMLLQEDAKPSPTDATGDTPVAGLPPPALGLAPAPTRGAPGERNPQLPATSSPDAVLRVTIVERVLGPDGNPLAGASVEVRIGGEVVARGASDSAGAVSIDVDPNDPDVPGAMVITRSAGGLTAALPAAWVSGWNSPQRGRLRRVDLGDVSLVAGKSIEFRVSDETGSGVVADLVVSHPWLPGDPIATGTSTADGRATIPGIPPGNYCAWARNSKGRGIAWFSTGRGAAGPVEVVLAGPRDVEILVVEKGTRTPVAGARIAVSEAVKTPESFYAALDYVPRLVIAPTDAQGRTRLVGVAKGASVSLTATASGFPTPAYGPFGGRQGTPVPVDATGVEIALDRGRTVTWQVTEGEVPPPPDGTPLPLEQQAGSGTSGPPGVSGRMEGGRIVVDGVLPEPTHWLAVAPDGSHATLFSLPGQAEGRATSFVKPRTVDVRLRWSDGVPAAGLFVSLRNQGNNPMGAVVQTDASGAALIERLELQQADVYAGPTNAPFSGRRIATADLRTGSARIESTLPRRREGVITVLLDGVPGLPDDLAPGWGSDLQILSRDASAGTLRVLAWPAFPDASMDLRFAAVGWMALSGVSVASGSGAFEGRLTLRRAGRVDVEVVRLGASPVSLRLDRLDWSSTAATASKFSSDTYGSGQAQIDAEGHWRLPTVPPGRYRVRDALSSSASDDFDVVAGVTSITKIDCSNVGVIEGWVLVPEGETAAGVTVRMTSTPPEADPFGRTAGGRVGPDGAFKLTVPGGRDVELTADDAVLVPADVGGTVRARVGAKDVRIRLALGPSCRVEFDRAPATSPFPGRPTTVRVFLWRGPMSGEPTSRSKAVLAGKAVRFGRYDPGTYSIAMDVPGVAPVVFTDVALGTGATQLGPVTLSAGSSIRFEVTVPAGQSVPRLAASVESLDTAFKYSRWSEDRDGRQITGLGKGRFRVKVHPVMGTMDGGAALLDQEVEVDGVADLTLRIELK